MGVPLKALVFQWRRLGLFEMNAFVKRVLPRQFVNLMLFRYDFFSASVKMAFNK